MPQDCNRKWLTEFLSDQFPLDDKLNFLFHLDQCRNCWNALYEAAKVRHPEYYRKVRRRMKTSNKVLGHSAKTV